MTTSPKPTKNTLVTDLLTLVENRIKKQVNFMQAKVEVLKLTLGETMEVQKWATEAAGEDPEMAFKMIRDVLRLGVPGMAEFTDDDFNKFPMFDLNDLADEVLKYGGMDPNRK